MTQATQNRTGVYDTLRAFAAMAVVLIHVIGGWKADPLGAASFYASATARLLLDGVVFQLLTRWAVPVFFLISGALLLDPGREMPVEKLKRYIGRIAAVLLTFGYFYCLLELAATQKAIRPALFGEAVRGLLEADCWAHMWYLYALLGLYLLLPPLRCFVRQAAWREARFFLLCLLLVQSVIPTVNGLLGLNLTVFGLRQAGASLFYFLAGHYLAQDVFSAAAARRAVAVSGTFIAAFQTFAVFHGGPEVVAPESLLIVIFSCSVFVLARSSAACERLSQRAAIRFLARHSFAVYLVHPFFLNLLNKGLHLFPGILPPGVGEAAFFAAALSLSVIASAILHRLPLFRKLV